MTAQANSSKSAKPSFGKRLLALFLVLLFVGVGGSILFFAKKTQHESFAFLNLNGGKTEMAAASVPVPAPVPTPAADSEKSLSADNMVAVETPSSSPAASGNEADLSNVTNEIAALKMQLQNMQIDLAEKAGTARAATELSETISSLQKDMLAMTEKMGALEKIVLNVQESTRKGLQNDVALVLAASQLQMALTSGQPYGESLDMVQKLAQGNSELETVLTPLKDNAATGIAPAPQLQKQFAQIEKRVMRQEAGNGAKQWAASWAGDGMVADTFGTLASLVTIRRVDADDEAGLDATLAKIDMALQKNQFAEAAEQSRNLPNEYKDQEVAEWQAQVAGKAKSDQAIRDLQKMLLQRLHNSANQTVN